MSAIEIIESPQVVEFSGPEEGPKLLIFGAIHGNEPAGTRAIEKIIEEINAKKTILTKGSLTFVPICNPKAYESNQRGVEDKNLNRVFRHHDEPQYYEQYLANFLTPLVDDCDYLLDLHTFTAEGPPFVFEDYKADGYREMALAQGITYILSGWPSLYRGDAQNEFYDTSRYAYEKGKVTVTSECGQHEDINAPELAYQCIYRTLVWLGMIKAESLKPIQPIIVEMQEVIYRRKEEAIFLKAWKNMDLVKKDQAIACLSNGETLRAPGDGVIIMPKSTAKPDEELYYFGRIVPCKQR